MKFEKFAPLTKVDLQSGTITGTATSGLEVDRQGERLDYPGSKAAFQHWSDSVAAATGGRSKGNLREMHGPVAAGYVTGLNFDDANQCVSITGRVVDPNTLRKCELSVLNSLSVGGQYGAKRRDPLNRGAVLYVVGQVNEISLVDYPALGSAQFELTKANGSVELRKFAKQARDQAGQFVGPVHRANHAVLSQRGFEHVHNASNLSSYTNADTGHVASTRKDGAWYSRPRSNGGVHHGYGPGELAAHLDGERHMNQEAQRLRAHLPYRDRAGEPLSGEEATKIFASGRRANLADVVAAVEKTAQRRPRVLLIGGRF